MSIRENATFGKRRERERLARDIERFLAEGGQIREIPRGVGALDMTKKHHREGPGRIGGWS